MTCPPSEIVIPPSFAFPLDSLADAPSRERFLSTLRPIDPTSLGRKEVDDLMNTMKLAFMVFGQKLTSLETEMELRESRMAQEIRQLRSELAIVRLEAELRDTKLQNEVDKQRLSNERMDKVIELAKVMEGDQYRPYAVKVALSDVDLILRPEKKKTSSKQEKTKFLLPADFDQRLAQAQSSGFKWRNNLVPVKDSKKLEKLEEWERSFQAGLDMTEEELLDMDYVFSWGRGAESAALIRLQEIFKADLVKKYPGSNRHNLYQKAVKMALEGPTVEEKVVSKYLLLVETYWANQPDNIKASITKLFDDRGLSLKTFKLCTTQTVQPSPQAFPYDEGDLDGDDRWVAIRDGGYDDVIEKIVTSWV
jgi:hypothetical protein